MSVTELILKAKSRKASEVIFLVGSEPKARIYGEWTALKDTPLLGSEWNVLVSSLLTSIQKNQLEQSGVCTGESQFGGQRLGFSFFENNHIQRLILNLGDVDSSSDFLPTSALMESLSSLQGLYLLSGVRDGKLTQSIQAALETLNQEKSFVTLIVSANPFAQIKEARGSFMYAPAHDSSWTQPEIFKGVDCVVLDGIHSEENLIKAIELAENGIAVIYTMTASSSLSSLKRCYSAVEKHFGSLGKSRFAEVIAMIYGQVVLKGLNSDFVIASEFVTVKPHIRGYIENEDMKSLEALFKGSAESVGVQSLNQSLLQNLVRRKIDLKSAFLASKDPENLDLLLKKVGV